MNQVNLIGVIKKCTPQSVIIDVNNTIIEVIMARNENQEIGKKIAISGELIQDPIDEKLKVVCFNNKDQNNCLIF